MAFCLHLLGPDSHFVDIGANVGSYTVLAAGASGARVTAVEPIPATFERLLDNVCLNRLDERVQCLMYGLSDQRGALRFRSDLDTVNHVLQEGDEGPSIEVEVVTLDEMIKDDFPILIKIDVEGHELQS